MKQIFNPSMIAAEKAKSNLTAITPLLPVSGPTTSSFNGLNYESKFLALIFFFVLSFLGTSSELIAQDKKASPKKPNLIVLFIDDLGFGDIGANGCPDIPTPHIDSLAKNGVLCTNGYTVANVCTPSRVGLMTGMYPQRFGVHHINQRGYPIPKDHPTMAEFMKENGYVTGMVGRWDIGDADQGPLNRGFMEVAKRDFAPVGHPKRHFKRPGPSYILPDGSYLTETSGLQLAEFVTRHKDKPFFLYFAPLGVHFPVDEVPQKYIERAPKVKDKRRKMLAGTLIALDDAIGLLLKALKEHDLEEDTMIVFTSDNGGKNGDGATSTPYRDGKHSMWDGDVHMPFIVQWKGTLPASTKYEGLVSTLDIYASAADLVGQSKPKACDGNSFLPYLMGKKEGDVQETLFWGIKGIKHAARKGPWRIVRPNGKQPWQLYHLTQDPGEKKNLAAQHPDIVKDLAERFEAWRKRHGNPVGPRKGAGGRYPKGTGWEFLSK